MRIKLKGSRNTRYVDSYESLYGGHVKPNTFIRSGRFGRVSKKNLNKFIKENDVKTVIDLRTPVEVNEESKVLYPKTVDYIHIPVLNQSFFGITHEKHMSRVMYKERVKINKNYTSDNYMESMYENLLSDEGSINKFKEILDIVLKNDDGAIVYHCSSGKDRTGLVTLFILSILGVKENDIIDDYIMSNHYNRRYIINREILLTLFLYIRRMKKLLFSMMKAKKRYIEHSIQFLNEKYGSVINFLEEKLDITEEKQILFREKFLIK